MDTVPYAEIGIKEIACSTGIEKVIVLENSDILGAIFCNFRRQVECYSENAPLSFL